ncbi:phage tail tube protein [Arthrobacter sp. CP30]
MPKSLADGRKKVSLLVEEPANPYAPTIAELNAGIDASCRILSSDYMLGPTDSDKIPEKELCKEGNANAIGASNYQARMTPFRYWDETTNAAHATEDEVYQALKEKGTEFFVYERDTAKKSTEAWAIGDEVEGYRIITDNPQRPSDMGGYQKRVVPMEVQDAFLNGVVDPVSG